MFRWLYLILVLIPASLSYGQRGPSRAAALAEAFLANREPGLKAGRVIEFGPEGPGRIAAVTFLPSGFVLVANPESDPEIIGYSATEAFPDDPAHPLISWFIPASQASRGRLKTSSELKFTTDRMVLPLTSAKWGQDDPWNKYCPSGTDGQRALVGCVAVAMAQIMEKWHWPRQAIGEVRYTPLLHPEYGELVARFDTTMYRWEQMHDIYPADASAILLYQAAVSTYTNFDPVSSSTSVDRYAIPALVDNFLYHRGMVFRSKEDYSHPEWIRMLRQELDNERPVLYAGTTPDGRSSHAFNIDGYRNYDWFHFNWGWNGAGNGWYSLNGMAGGGSDFSTQQGAIFGMQPFTMPLHDRPSGLDAMAGNGFVQLFWEAPVLADFSHYTVYRNGIKTGETAYPSFRDTSASDGTAYAYTVTANYEGGQPGESNATPALSVIPWEAASDGHSQDFESGTTGWQLTDAVGGFHITTPGSAGFAGRSGRIAAIRSEGHPDGEQVTDYLASPAIYNDTDPRLAISFDYLFRHKPGVDTLLLLWRSFTDGKWKVIASLDSTGGYSDWKTLHFYIPEPGDDQPLQVAFYYNDHFGQGYGAAIDDIRIYAVPEKTLPAFEVNLTDACQGQAVTFTDHSTGPVVTREWDFGEGAEPRFASTEGPHEVRYRTAGPKEVRLSLNHLDHLFKPALLSVRNTPQAGFSYLRKYQDIQFNDTSKFAESVLWDFGDGHGSVLRSPLHTYYSKSLFQVMQVVYNGPCDPDTSITVIDLRNGTGMDDDDMHDGVVIFPNPVRNRLQASFTTPPAAAVTAILWSVTGKEILRREYPPVTDLTFDLSDIPPGMYILRLTTGSLVRNEQILKINN